WPMMRPSSIRMTTGMESSGRKSGSYTRTLRAQALCACAEPAKISMRAAISFIGYSPGRSKCYNHCLFLEAHLTSVRAHVEGRVSDTGSLLSPEPQWKRPQFATYSRLQLRR